MKENTQIICLSNIENSIANELNMEFDSKNPYINKEIKF